MLYSSNNDGSKEVIENDAIRGQDELIECKSNLPTNVDFDSGLYLKYNSLMNIFYGAMI